MKKLLYLLFGLMFSQTQAQYQRLDFPLYRGTDTLSKPWVGGLNLPQFSAIDLNNDGKKDLLVYDRAGQIALTFLNIGSPGQIAYRHAPEFESRFPQGTANFMLAKDYNCDGIEDLFYFNQPPSTSGGIGVLRGSYDAQNRIQFTEVAPLLQYNEPPFGLSDIFIYNTDLPAIDDIDGDGDIDVLAFSLDFIYFRNVFFYKNTSAERGHGCDSLTFVAQHKCWGMFSEGGNNNSVLISPGIDSCADNPYWRSPRHIGSTLTMLDWNKDGVTDLLMGDVSVNSLNLLTADLIRDTFLVVQQDSLFPVYDRSVNVFSYPGAFLVDVNNDGKRDLIAAPNEMGFGEAVLDSVAWLYLDTQSLSTAPMRMAFQQKDFLVGEMMDLGMGSYPAVLDYNGDGLLDLVVGNTTQCTPAGDLSTQLVLFQNVGTATQPSFRLTDANLAQLDTLDLLGLKPTFGDLDGDGDMDLILGNSLGTLTYVRNIGTAQNPQWASPVRDYSNITAGSFSAPQLVDMDRDGDLDLMIGTQNNNMHYYENTGSRTNPSFTFRSNTFGVDLNVLGSGRSIPFFMDRGGEMQLFLGHQLGTIIHLNNINNNITGIYDTLTTRLGGMYVGQYSTIAVADFNQDDSLDFVLGSVRGGLTIYTSHPNPTINQQAIPLAEAADCLIFPNPSTGVVNLRFEQPQMGLRYSVCNALGQVLLSESWPEGQAFHRLDLSALPVGMYYLVWQDGQGQKTQKMILNR